MGSITKNLEDQITKAITLDKETPKGFRACYCPVCKDHTKRAGFKFEDDQIIYNCFRGKCNASCGYTEGEYLSKKFKTLMKSLGVKIPIEAYNTNTQVQKKVELNENLFKPHSYDPYEPEKEYLKPIIHDRASIDGGLARYRRVCYEYNHLIRIAFHGNSTYSGIKCYLDQMLIGVIEVKSNEQYNKHSNNSHLIFVPDGEIPDEPIIVEGAFDALCIPNAVAVLGDHISPQQAYFLRNKKPIFLPDRGNNRFFEQAKQYGWRISVPLWDEKDVNEYVQKYGLLNAVHKIRGAIHEDADIAEVMMRFYQ